MPSLALVCCPLPAEGPSARAAQELLRRPGESRDVRVFCAEPYHAPPPWHREHGVMPLADLPVERARGAVSAPIYLLDDGPGAPALERYRQQVPGVEADAAAALDPEGLQRAALRLEPEPAVHPVVGGPLVEAMVLAWRSKDYIAPCLESLLEQDWPDLRITVLDNASRDGTADFVRRRFPDIEVIESESNLGFAGGHNLMFARSRADFLALLNHDAVARRNWISELVSAAQANPRGALFGSKMLMRRCPTVLNSTGILMNESGFAADRDIGRKDRDPSAAVARIFAASGGALFGRRELVQQLRGFDEAFFMYVEDVDLCWRARLAGHEVYYVPTAVVVHDWHGDLARDAEGEEPEAAVAGREGRRRFMVERNRLQTVYKNWSRPNLRRVWRGLKQHDRGRIEALRDHVARGGGPLPEKVLEAVLSAHRWCLLHRPGMFLRRLHAQRLRTVGDGTFQDLIVSGFHEPSAVGDLHVIVDPHCAEGRAEIRMGSADRGCLGPGWHHAEPDGARWTMAECWFYLQSEEPWRTVWLELTPPPMPTWAELWVDCMHAGRLEVRQGEAQELRFESPAEVCAGHAAECRLWCGAFVPLQEGMGGDQRELGVRVARIRVE